MDLLKALSARQVTQAGAIFAVTSSLLLVLRHLMAYRSPNRQRLVIRCLLMIPIYAIDSLIGFEIRYDNSAMSLIRDTYESFVLFNFFFLLVELAGGEKKLLEYWRTEHPTIDHMFPLRGKMALNASALAKFRFFMLQYAILSPLLTLGTLLGEKYGFYDEDSWSLEDFHTYATILRAVSVTFAFTALMYLYLSIKHKYHHLDPTGKFISIKAVVFLCCWQPLILWGLSLAGWLPMQWFRRSFLSVEESAKYADDEVVAAVESAMVVLEVACASVMHWRVFSPSGEYLGTEQKKPTLGLGGAVAHCLSIGDVVAETGRVAGETKKRN